MKLIKCLPAMVIFTGIRLFLTDPCLGQAGGAYLHVTILDEETQQPVPVRVRLTHENSHTAMQGRSPCPGSRLSPMEKSLQPPRLVMRGSHPDIYPYGWTCRWKRKPG